MFYRIHQGVGYKYYMQLHINILIVYILYYCALIINDIIQYVIS